MNKYAPRSPHPVRVHSINVTHSVQPTERRTLRRGESQLAGSEPAGFFGWFPGDEATLVAKSKPTSALHFNGLPSPRRNVRLSKPYIFVRS